MYGCDKRVTLTPDHLEREVIRAYWEMVAAVQASGKGAEQMRIEITQKDGLTIVGWRAHEKATTT